MIQMLVVRCMVFIAVSAFSSNAEVRLTRFEHRRDAFEVFIQRYGRGYIKDSDEYKYRLSIFSKRLAKVDMLNSRPSRLWTAGASPLADLTQEELERKRGYFGKALAPKGHGSVPCALALVNQLTAFLGVSAKEEKLPAHVDVWDNLQALERVSEQGTHCGSSWAETTATVLAAHAEIYNASQRNFSAKELLACVPNPQKCGGAGKCPGATVELAMAYVLKDGLSQAKAADFGSDACPKKLSKNALAFKQELEKALTDKGDTLLEPGVHDANMRSKGLVSFGLKAWERLPQNRYDALVLALYERGPAAVSVDARDWDIYMTGIFDSCKKDSIIINHVATLIGYGKDEKQQKYWLIQNSWGDSFGEKGRIRLLRQDAEEKACGVDSQPEVGTGCAGGPKQVKVCGTCGILYDSVVPHFKPQK
eukprot:TRINITY_DN10296_c0_g4_i1.p1 TRINITY_DN10296_c0_g4~~TRINITY_DN10296_c0_g4_i1.p1  ORF type:complete len:421 (-),score=58.19 TRINITY_DN10296_c0_g4_i1:115-1377(-)